MELLCSEIFSQNPFICESKFVVIRCFVCSKVVMMLLWSKFHISCLHAERIKRECQQSIGLSHTVCFFILFVPRWKYITTNQTEKRTNNNMETVEFQIKCTKIENKAEVKRLQQKTWTMPYCFDMDLKIIAAVYS